MAKHYHIDVWQGESIWSWKGRAEDDTDAKLQALAVLNEDWDESYATWDDLAADMDGTALLYDTFAEKLHLYRQLHDGLSDMVEGGRLSEGDIPDDYRWLVESLAKLASLDPA